MSIDKIIARKKIRSLEETSFAPGFVASDYTKNSKNAYWISLICKDNSIATWYIKTFLNSFEDHDIGNFSKEKLWQFENRALVAYIYEKVVSLRGMGYNCRFHLHHDSISSNIRVSDLIIAIDVMVDEILQTTSVEKSEIDISLAKGKKGRLNIEVNNRNDLIPLKDIVRMQLHDYSFKTKKIRGIRKLSVICLENDGILRMRWEDNIGKNIQYFFLRYEL